ncbi:MAG: bifunctional biotin--[acetyl-CoA-carboxylase] ligase/biotin operon repressor BirA [Chromatiales bacterium]|jgi:BirA family biotin operon repressor/biotin-[acetyl-CoA-carboxylase] ligase
MDSCQRILDCLSDGLFHSGEDMAQQLAVSRTTIANHIQKLQQDYALDIHAVSGRGYRLPGGLERLDRDAILAQLVEAGITPGDCQLHQSLESTNRFLLDKPLSHADKTDVCLAEMQTAGRGRRGRQWLSPYGRNIYLSLAQNLNMSMQQVAGLSLAIGTAVAQCLTQLGTRELALKWPNDIHWRNRKLAGLLIELKGEAEGPLKIVVGVGVNHAIGERHREKIDQPVTDLLTVMGTAAPSRNQLAASLVQHMVAAINEFEQQGLQPFVERWNRFDLYLGQQVTLTGPSWSVGGIYQGIDSSGAIRLLVDGEARQFSAGEVSLRAAEVVS